jgi:hypothetical protein
MLREEPDAALDSHRVSVIHSSPAVRLILGVIFMADMSDVAYA